RQRSFSPPERAWPGGRSSLAGDRPRTMPAPAGAMIRSTTRPSPAMNPTASRPAPSPSPSDALDGTVERVTFYNPENGYSVVKLRVRGRREPVAVVGTLPAAQPGEMLVLSG